MDWFNLASGRLADAAVGGTIVLVVGSLAARLSRQPVQRVRIVMLTLLGAAVVPFLDRLSVAPRWSVGVLPAPAASPIAAPNTTAPAPPALPSMLDRVPAVAAEMKTRGVAAPRNVVRSEPPRPSVEAPRWALPSIGSLAVVGYVAAAAGSAAWWLLGQAAFWRVVRAARPASAMVRDVFLEIAGPSGRQVRLLESDRVDLPFTNTWIRPVILLPAGLCDGREVETLRYALAHEWSHVERRDSWAWTLAMLSGLVLFYQPLFWWLRRQLRLGQDFLADARAAEVGSAEDYAAFLVRLARSKQAGPAWPALGIGDRRSNLHRRVLMLVQSQPLEKRCRPAWSAAVALTSIVVVLVASGLRLDAAPPAKEAAVQDPAKPAGEAFHYKGTVKDKDTGKPIAGATVVVRRSFYTTMEDRVLQETRHTTAADGTYEFTIPPEQAAEPKLYIELDVAHPDYATRAGFGYSFAMSRKNEKLGERPFFETIELRPARAIAGKVETPDGAPAAGVEVMSYSMSSKLPKGQLEYGSFAKMKTAEDGSFRLPITTPGIGVFWILPKDYAQEMHDLVEGRRGDLGTFRLKPGVRLSGRVLDAEGKPKPGVLLEISRERRDGPESEVYGHLAVADMVRRIVESDADGRFVTDPLPAGGFVAAPTDFDSRGERSGGWKRREQPGPFARTKVEIKEGETPAVVELREQPSVVVEGRWIDSQGRPKSGWSNSIFAKLDGQSWWGETRVDPEGRFSLKVPRGLTEATMDVMLNEHTAARHRSAKDAPLKEGRRIPLGTLDRDVKGIEIVRYVAPIIIVNATTKDGKQIEGFKAEVEYVGDLGDLDKDVYLAGGGKIKDKLQDEQNDGRYRTSQLLPDREVRVSVSADGFAPAERTMKLAEGVTEEANFVLEPK